MNKKLFLIGISLVSSLYLVSCGNSVKSESENSVSQSERIKQLEEENQKLKQTEITQSERIEQFEAEAQKLKQQKEEKAKVRTFTTNMGTFDYDKALNAAYTNGYDAGLFAKKQGTRFNAKEQYYNEAKSGYEGQWVYSFGVPTSTEAKDAFEACQKQYIKGLDEAFGK